MLKSLRIKNVALIDDVTIDFAKGLNILSGETGSGKSIIIESLNFVLGAKADKSMITTGESFCSVVAEFDVFGNENIANLYAEFDFEQDDLLIISRKFTVDGKGDIKINGNSVTASMLKKFTVHLVDIHGQSEHFYLLKESNQLTLIDEYCGKEVDEIKADIKDIYSEYTKVIDVIDSLGGDEKSRNIKLDILSYQIKEINDANLIEGEEDELNAARKKLLNKEKISNGLNSARDALEGENGAVDTVRNALYSLSTISSIDDAYSEIFSRLDNVNDELNDIANTVNSFINDDYDEEINLDEIENRLEVIKKLKKKYGSDYTEIMNFLNEITEEYDKLLSYDDILEKQNKIKAELEKRLYSKYCLLSETRKKYAKIFSETVTKELSELGMQKAIFDISFSAKPSMEDCLFNSIGFDKIEFLFSANAGESLKPLSKIISGGEISRFMLAVKTASQKVQNVSTFVFDEIDAGISGHIASVVAEKFAKISKTTQIIAITHLPQISAMSDNSLLIYKKEVDGKTKTFVNNLDETSKINEITRLVGGTIDSSAAIEHAKNMIFVANKFKESL